MRTHALSPKGSPDITMKKKRVIYKFAQFQSVNLKNIKCSSKVSS